MGRFLWIFKLNIFIIALILVVMMMERARTRQFAGWVSEFLGLNPQVESTQEAGR